MTERNGTRLLGMATTMAAMAMIAGLMACGGPAKPSADLSHDLEAASGPSALTLAPSAGRQDVVSAIERSPAAAPAPAAASRGSAPVTPSSVAPPPAEPVVAATIPAPATTPAQTVATASDEAKPAPTGAVRSRRPVPVHSPHGGYKTEAEVIRNAPFPINP